MSILATNLLLFTAPLQHALEPGVPHSVELPYTTGELESFTIDVPSTARAMYVRLENGTHDLDLDASWIPEGEYTDHYYFAENTWFERSLYIPVTEPNGLAEGRWQLDVMVPESALVFGVPEVASAELTVAFPDPFEGALALDEIAEVHLSRSNALRAIFSVPQDLDRDREYRIEAYSPVADIDLVIGNHGMLNILGIPAALEFGALNYESTTLTGGVLRVAEVHVFAHSGSINAAEIPVRVRLTPVADGTLPPSLVGPIDWPTLAENASPMERALASTVALYGKKVSGSGSLIGANGLILTSAHVVFAPENASQPRGSAADFEASSMVGMFAGFTRELDRAPMPQVGLQLLDYRRDADLALLRVHTTFDGRPLAAQELPELPAVPLGDSLAAQLGDPLFTLGFPMTGGTGKFVSLTLGRGIIAGFAQQLGFASLKTDAALHAGVSGGLMLDAAWNLIGVPDMNITDENGAGGIGFAIPVHEVPASWQRLIQADLDAVVAQLSSGRLVGFEALSGDDALGLAQDLVELERLLEPLTRSTSHGGATPSHPHAEAALRARLPYSLGAFHALALHEPARATAVYAQARALAPNADLPSADDAQAWADLWASLRAAPAAWADRSGLTGAERTAYLKDVARAHRRERERRAGM